MTAIDRTVSDAERQLLEQRARALARRPADETRDSSIELLRFSLARESWAVEAHHTVAVFRLRQLTPLPSARAPLYGLTSWRGDVLTLLDLRPLVGAPSTALDDLAFVIVLTDGDQTFGLLADSVSELSSIAADELRPPPESRSAAREYIAAMTTDAALLLDALGLIAATGAPAATRNSSLTTHESRS